MVSKRILIVDDSPVVLAQMRLFLAEEGFDVIEATNGQQGLEKALSQHPDLILSDLAMPQMTGLEMLRALRSEGSSIPCFVLSTETSKTLVAEGRTVGVKAWMAKPFKPAALLKGIRMVLEQE